MKELTLFHCSSPYLKSQNDFDFQIKINQIKAGLYRSFLCKVFISNKILTKCSLIASIRPPLINLLVIVTCVHLKNSHRILVDYFSSPDILKNIFKLLKNFVKAFFMLVEKKVKYTLMFHVESHAFYSCFLGRKVSKKIINDRLF